MIFILKTDATPQVERKFLLVRVAHKLCLSLSKSQYWTISDEVPCLGYDVSALAAH